MYGRLHFISSPLANPEFPREFLSPIKVSWPPERLINNSKCTSLNSTEIHPFQLCLSSYFIYSWQLGWMMSCQECFFLGTKRCRSGHEPSSGCGVMAGGSSAWLWLLFQGKVQITGGKSSHCSASRGLLFSIPG